LSKSEQAEKAGKLLEAAGLRVTPVRVLILGQLLKAGRPISHNDLWKKKRIRSFNRVTVYRTLVTLRNRRIVQAVQGVDGVWRFCAHAGQQNGCPGNHPHFVCKRCRRMTCLLGQTMPFVEVPDGTVVEAKQLVAYGICARCAQESAKDRPKVAAAGPQSSRQR
jgi:Fur family ferric uptake transcriptional regulator/Fur family zinc uptake transcriptional regulator